MVILMKNYSLWQQEVKRTYQELVKDTECDILIIGAGISGISIAYQLRNSKYKICVVESDMVGSKTTARTTGKITYLQDLMYSKISDTYSFDVAKKYYEAQKEAIETIKNIVQTENIDCDFVEQSSYLFASTKDEVKAIKKEAEILTNLHVKYKEIKKVPAKINSYYGIRVDDTYYFHAVKYLNALAKICFEHGISIYEKSVVKKFRKLNDYYEVIVNNSIVKAKKIVFAGHYPFFLRPFLFPLKGSLEQSYISGIKVNEEKYSSGINTSKNTKSFRYHHDNSTNNNYLIYLSNSDVLNKVVNIEEKFNDLESELHAKDLKGEYLWTNCDIITNDYLPYIGKITNDFFIATGYNTWGMTNSTIASLIIKDLINNETNKYTNIFNPNRVQDIFKIVKNMYYNVIPYFTTKIHPNKSIYPPNVKFTKKNGEDVAIYIDEANVEHIVYNKCPHLKCSLIFNEVEKTWDCPCHSSRFDIDGNCIKGPSNYNITYKKKNN